MANREMTVKARERSERKKEGKAEKERKEGRWSNTGHKKVKSGKKTMSMQKMKDSEN